MTAAMIAEFPDEDFGWMGDVTSIVYQALHDAGWPYIDRNSGGVLGRICGLLLQRHLDGSGWIMHWHGGMTCVPVEVLGEPSGTDPVALRAWRPVNLHDLSESHVRVLKVIAGPMTVTSLTAGSTSWSAGVIDEEIANVTGLAVSTIGHLRGHLVHKFLVVEKSGLYSKRESATGTRAQLWVATRTGYQALRPPAPSLDLLVAQLDRQAAPPG